MGICHSMKFVGLPELTFFSGNHRY